MIRGSDRGHDAARAAGGAADGVTAPRPPLRVAAGILRRDGTILACQRRRGAPFPLRWELPGGKLDAGESAAAALARELHEELGVDAEVGPEVARVAHDYGDHPPVLLHFFEVRRFAPDPRNLAFESIRWARPAEMLALDWLEADLELVRRLAAADGPLPPLQRKGERW